MIVVFLYCIGTRKNTIVRYPEVLCLLSMFSFPPVLVEMWIICLRGKLTF